MTPWPAVGVLRLTIDSIAGASAFVAFARITAHVVDAVALQVWTAVLMGMLTAVVVHQVMGDSVIPRILVLVRGANRRT